MIPSILHPSFANKNQQPSTIKNERGCVCVFRQVRTVVVSGLRLPCEYVGVYYKRLKLEAIIRLEINRHPTSCNVVVVFGFVDYSCICLKAGVAISLYQIHYKLFPNYLF